MRLAVLGCSRTPALEDVASGLGRSSWDVAKGLAARGHDVSYLGAYGSSVPGCEMLLFGSEHAMHSQAVGLPVDAFFDYSHSHMLSQMGDLPVLSVIGDSETTHQPPNAVVATEYMRTKFPTAKLVRFGIDFDAIPFGEGGDRLVFMARMHHQKGWDRALEAAAIAGRDILFIGPGGFGFGLENYAGALLGAEKWAAIGSSLAMLCPYDGDASPRTPLEAAGCGTPTLCLAGDGTEEHVIDGVTGLVCRDLEEMAARVDEIGRLARSRVVDEAKERYSMSNMLDRYEELLAAVAAGERW